MTLITSYIFHYPKVHATLVILTQRGLMSTDELRRAMEALPGHREMSYYHRWAAGMIAVSLERGTFTRTALDTVLGEEERSVTEPSFRIGDKVVVRREDSRVRWRKPHIRTPGYLFGASGVIERFLGCYPNPEKEAFISDRSGNVQPLYLVTFKQGDLWASSSHNVEVTAEIYEPWINIAEDIEYPDKIVKIDSISYDDDVIDHGDHVHDTRADTEAEAVRREMLTVDPLGQRMAELLIQVLKDVSILDTRSIMDVVEMMDSRGKMLLGQKLVVRAWTDPEFKTRLLEDGNVAAAELGIVASNANSPTKFVVVENCASVHHVIVCTLCSCYPSGVLGMAPAWYKSRSYRARTIREPRKVLAEFGLSIPEEVRPLFFNVFSIDMFIFCSR